jgi:hypothetical protein
VLSSSTTTRARADLVALFGDRGVYADEAARPGVSGAVLAYEEVWYPLGGDSARFSPMWGPRDFAETIGVRDTWQTGRRQQWREACAVSAGLGLWSRDVLVREGLSAILRYYNLRRVGEALLAQQEASDAQTVEEAHRFEVARGGGVAPLRVACFAGSSREASDIAEALRDDVDLVVAWKYFVRDRRHHVRLSLRSRGEWQCLPLAQWLGGNGHPHAAGCVLALEDRACGHRDPYQLVESLVRGFFAYEPPSDY